MPNTKEMTVHVPSYQYYDVLRYTWAQPALQRGRIIQPFLLNRRPITSQEFERLRSSSHRCVFCDTGLVQRAEPRLRETRLGGGQVSVCASCGYWYIEHGKGSDLGGYFRYVGAKLMEYPEAAGDLPTAELAAYLRTHPDRIYHISPRALERLVAECFRTTSGYAEAMHVGRPDDGGVDVLLVTEEKRKVLVQVKRRGPDQTETVGTLRNLLGAMVIEGSLKGIVVSTADHFSYRAQLVAKALESSGDSYRIELRDLGRLRSMIGDVSDPQPWYTYIATAREEDVLL